MIDTPFLFCLSFLLGIGFGSFLNIPSQIAYFLLVSSLIFFCLFFFKKKHFFTLLGGALLSLGFSLLLINSSTESLNKFRDQEINTKEVNLRAEVKSEKELRQDYSRYILSSEEGKILLLTDKNNDFKYGDTLLLKGKIELPQQFSDFDYQGYLAKEDIYWVAPFLGVEVIEKAKESFKNEFYQGLYSLRQKIRLNSIKSFSQKQSSFLRAIILGDKGVVSDDFRQELSRSGTSHMVAISGLHLSILAVFVFGGLLYIGLARKQASLITILLIILFVVFIGFRASLVRAGFMASLALLSLSSGRIFRGERALIYVASLMLLFNPLLLRYDIGFQLSFLAVLGILLLKPLFDYVFVKKLKISQFFSDALTVTLSAQIFTLPIIIYNFGIFSLIAPIVNLIILLFLPLILGLSFLWGIFSLFLNPLVITFILSILFKPFLGFISWTSRLPFASIEMQTKTSLVFIIAYYLILIICIYFWKKFYKENLIPLALWKKWKNEQKIN